MTTSAIHKPRKKPGVSRGVTVQQPLPVPIAALTGKPACNAIWRWYKGTFTGHSVLIEDEEHVKILYSMVSLPFPIYLPCKWKNLFFKKNAEIF